MKFDKLVYYNWNRLGNFWIKLILESLEKILLIFFKYISMFCSKLIFIWNVYIDDNECKGYLCRNKGICVNTVGFYKCNCFF